MATPYRFSSTLNKFTTIGCMTLAYLTVSDTVNSYFSGCVSMCRSRESLSNSSCTGIGCCQTAIPKGIDYCRVRFDENFNSSETYNFSRCGYAVLVEERAFEFSTSYITTGELYRRRLPLMVDWAASRASQISSRTRVEHEPARSFASPTQGGYWCSCPRGTHGDASSSGTCYPSQKLPLAVRLVIGICISLLIILIIMLCIHIILERRKLIKVKEENFRQHGGWLLLEEIGKRQGLAFKMFTEEELEQATNKFHKNNIIGNGSHGTVYKGILKDNRVIAIKRAKIINERQKKEFGKEMLILSQINHRNIVKLLGCCLEVEVPMLVYEYISNGTLFQLIHGISRRIYISLETRLKIALESAEALAYLHLSASTPIIHGDVKSANILLDDHLMAKVSDFGASILAPRDETQFVTLVQGTCGYLDPEYVQTCQLSDKSDVYSFGVVLLELLTGRKALHFEGTEIETSLSSTFLSAMNEGRFSELLDDQIEYDEEVERINEIAALAKACLNVKGEDMPSMKEVVEELNKKK
uniref:Protein kinase domain-containing protein n=1 Tax=Ananas comosus var. bracteatus TaxID=296719 RepID=A0A6V7P1M1_ANACO|nr:unnamed protein product [Ananas comosus var. bracteatus]